MIVHQSDTNQPSSQLGHFIADYIETGVSICETDEGFELIWTDFVANQWTEEYKSLSALLLRLAVLVRCGEEAWRLGFTQEPERFMISASQFFTEQAQ